MKCQVIFGNRWQSTEIPYTFTTGAIFGKFSLSKLLYINPSLVINLHISGPHKKKKNIPHKRPTQNRAYSPLKYLSISSTHSWKSKSSVVESVQRWDEEPHSFLHSSLRHTDGPVFASQVYLLLAVTCSFIFKKIFEAWIAYIYGVIWHTYPLLGIYVKDYNLFICS